MDAQEEIIWSTDNIERNDRIEAWRTFLVDAFQECDMEYEANSDFWARLSCNRYGDISIGKIAGSRRKAARTLEKAKFGTDGVVMTIACEGRYGYIRRIART